MELVDTLDVSVRGPGFACVLQDAKNNCMVNTVLCRQPDSMVLPESIYEAAESRGGFR